MVQLLGLIAAALVIFGIFKAVKGQVLLGVGLVILGLLVGPGGVSLFG